MQYNISFNGLPPGARYVSDKLIVGAKQGLCGLRKLKYEENVTRIIDLRQSKFLIANFLEKLYCRILGIKLYSIPFSLTDKSKKPEILIKKAIEIVDGNKTGSTYIHCRNGKHRSVLIAGSVEAFFKRIKTLEEFNKFLKVNHFFDNQITPKIFSTAKKVLKKIKDRKEILDFQRLNFIRYLFGEK